MDKDINVDLKETDFVKQLRKEKNYRAFVGPEELYDVIGAMQFNLLTFLGLRGDHYLLDIGCGSGAYGIRIAAKGFKTIGIDISKRLLKVAHRKSKEKKLDYNVILGDIENIPLKDESIDFVFCGFVLHHFPKFETTIGEIKKVLKKNGIFTIIEPNGSNPIVIFSKLIGNIIEKHHFKFMLTTENEINHTLIKYLTLFKKYNFEILLKESLYEWPKISYQDKLLRFFINIRALLSFMSWIIFSQPYNGKQLIIVVKKMS